MRPDISRSTSVIDKIRMFDQDRSHGNPPEPASPTRKVLLDRYQTRDPDETRTETSKQGSNYNATRQQRELDSNADPPGFQGISPARSSLVQYYSDAACARSSEKKVSWGKPSRHCPERSPSPSPIRPVSILKEKSKTSNVEQNSQSHTSYPSVATKQAAILQQLDRTWKPKTEIPAEAPIINIQNTGGTNAEYAGVTPTAKEFSPQRQSPEPRGAFLVPSFQQRTSASKSAHQNSVHVISAYQTSGPGDCPPTIPNQKKRTSVSRYSQAYEMSVRESMSPSSSRESTPSPQRQSQFSFSGSPTNHSYNQRPSQNPGQRHASRIVETNAKNIQERGNATRIGGTERPGQRNASPAAETNVNNTQERRDMTRMGGMMAVPERADLTRTADVGATLKTSGMDEMLLAKQFSQATISPQTIPLNTDQQTKEKESPSPNLSHSIPLVNLRKDPKTTFCSNSPSPNDFSKELRTTAKVLKELPRQSSAKDSPLKNERKTCGDGNLATETNLNSQRAASVESARLRVKRQPPVGFNGKHSLKTALQQKTGFTDGMLLSDNIEDELSSIQHARMRTREMDSASVDSNRNNELVSPQRKTGSVDGAPSFDDIEDELQQNLNASLSYQNGSGSLCPSPCNDEELPSISNKPKELSRSNGRKAEAIEQSPTPTLMKMQQLYEQRQAAKMGNPCSPKTVLQQKTGGALSSDNIEDELSSIQHARMRKREMDSASVDSNRDSKLVSPQRKTGSVDAALSFDDIEDELQQNLYASLSYQNGSGSSCPSPSNEELPSISNKPMASRSHGRKAAAREQTPTPTLMKMQQLYEQRQVAKMGSPHPPTDAKTSYGNIAPSDSSATSHSASTTQVSNKKTEPLSNVRYRRSFAENPVSSFRSRPVLSERAGKAIPSSPQMHGRLQKNRVETRRLKDTTKSDAASGSTLMKHGGSDFAGFRKSYVMVTVNRRGGIQGKREHRGPHDHEEAADLHSHYQQQEGLEKRRDDEYRDPYEKSYYVNPSPMERTMGERFPNQESSWGQDAEGSNEYWEPSHDLSKGLSPRNPYTSPQLTHTPEGNRDKSCDTRQVQSAEKVGGKLTQKRGRVKTPNHQLHNQLAGLDTVDPGCPRVVLGTPRSFSYDDSPNGSKTEEEYAHPRHGMDLTTKVSPSTPNAVMKRMRIDSMDYSSFGTPESSNSTASKEKNITTENHTLDNTANTEPVDATTEGQPNIHNEQARESKPKSLWSIAGMEKVAGSSEMYAECGTPGSASTLSDEAGFLVQSVGVRDQPPGRNTDTGDLELTATRKPLQSHPLAKCENKTQTFPEDENGVNLRHRSSPEDFPINPIQPDDQDDQIASPHREDLDSPKKTEPILDSPRGKVMAIRMSFENNSPSRKPPLSSPRTSPNEQQAAHNILNDERRSPIQQKHWAKSSSTAIPFCATQPNHPISCFVSNTGVVSSGDVPPTVPSALSSKESNCLSGQAAFASGPSEQACVDSRRRLLPEDPGFQQRNLPSDDRALAVLATMRDDRALVVPATTREVIEPQPLSLKQRKPNAIPSWPNNSERITDNRPDTFSNANGPSEHGTEDPSATPNFASRNEWASQHHSADPFSSHSAVRENRSSQSQLLKTSRVPANKTEENQEQDKFEMEISHSVVRENRSFQPPENRSSQYQLLKTVRAPAKKAGENQGQDNIEVECTSLEVSEANKKEHNISSEAAKMVGINQDVPKIEVECNEPEEEQLQGEEEEQVKNKIGFSTLEIQGERPGRKIPSPPEILEHEESTSAIETVQKEATPPSKPSSIASEKYSPTVSPAESPASLEKQTKIKGNKRKPYNPNLTASEGVRRMAIALQWWQERYSATAGEAENSVVNDALSPRHRALSPQLSPSSEAPQYPWSSLKSPGSEESSGLFDQSVDTNNVDIFFGLDEDTKVMSDDLHENLSPRSGGKEVDIRRKGTPEEESKAASGKSSAPGVATERRMMAFTLAEDDQYQLLPELVQRQAGGSIVSSISKGTSGATSSASRETGKTVADSVLPSTVKGTPGVTASSNRDKGKNVAISAREESSMYLSSDSGTSSKKRIHSIRTVSSNQDNGKNVAISAREEGSIYLSSDSGNSSKKRIHSPRTAYLRQPPPPPPPPQSSNNTRKPPFLADDFAPGRITFLPKMNDDDDDNVDGDDDEPGDSTCSSSFGPKLAPLNITGGRAKSIASDITESLISPTEGLSSQRSLNMSPSSSYGPKLAPISVTGGNAKSITSDMTESFAPPPTDPGSLKSQYISGEHGVEVDFDADVRNSRSWVRDRTISSAFESATNRGSGQKKTSALSSVSKKAKNRRSGPTQSVLGRNGEIESFASGSMEMEYEEYEGSAKTVPGSREHTEEPPPYFAYGYAILDAFAAACKGTGNGEVKDQCAENRSSGLYNQVRRKFLECCGEENDEEVSLAGDQGIRRGKSTPEDFVKESSRMSQFTCAEESRFSEFTGVESNTLNAPSLAETADEDKKRWSEWDEQHKAIPEDIEDTVDEERDPPSTLATDASSALAGTNFVESGQWSKSSEAKSSEEGNSTSTRRDQPSSSGGETSSGEESSRRTNIHERRVQAQQRLLDHAKQAKDWENCNRTVVSVQSDDSGNSGERAFEMSMPDVDNVDHIRPLRMNAPLTTQQKQVMERFSSMLRSERIEVLKLNRHLKWQVRYLTVSKEYSWLRGNESEGDVGYCPQALLWLKTAHGKNTGISGINDEGRGGFLFTQLERIERDSSKTPPAEIPKKLRQKFPTYVGVKIVYRTTDDGSPRSLLFCLKNRADARAFITSMEIIRAVIRREEEAALSPTGLA